MNSKLLIKETMHIVMESDVAFEMVDNENNPVMSGIRRGEQTGIYIHQKAVHFETETGLFIKFSPNILKRQLRPCTIKVESPNPEILKGWTPLWKRIFSHRRTISSTTKRMVDSTLETYI